MKELFRTSPLLRGASATLLVNVIGAGLVIVNHYLLAHALGADGLGGYSYAISWAGLVSLLAVGGIDSVVISQGSRIAKETAKLQGLFAWAGRDIFLGTVTAVVFYLAVVILRKKQLDILVSAAPLIIFLAAGSLRQSMLRAIKRPALARFPDIILRPGGLGILLALALVARRGVTAGEALIMHAAAALVAFIVGVVLVRRFTGRTTRLEINSESVNSWRRAARSFFLVTWAGVTFQELDMLIAGSQLGNVQAGYYATALRLAAFVPFGAQACDAALAPLISHRFSIGEAIGPLVRRAVMWNIALGITPVIVIGVFGRWILPFFGAEFIAAYPIMVVLAVGQFLALGFGPGGFVLSMTNNQAELAKMYTIWTVIALVLGLFVARYSGDPLHLSLVMAGCLLGRAIDGAVRCKKLLGINTTIFGRAGSKDRF